MYEESTLKAHMFCITLESLNTHKLTAKAIYYGKCVSTMENTEDLLYR